MDPKHGASPEPSRKTQLAGLVLGAVILVALLALAVRAAGWKPTLLGGVWGVAGGLLLSAAFRRLEANISRYAAPLLFIWIGVLALPVLGGVADKFVSYIAFITSAGAMAAHSEWAQRRRRG